MPRETLLDVFADFARLDHPFVIYDNGYRSWTYSYRQVADSARAFGSRLRRLGVAKGDRVLIWAENRGEWLVALWGCLLNGAVLVPVDYRASGDLLVRVQKTAGAKLLLVGEEVGPSPLGGDIQVWRLNEWDWQERAESFQPASAAPADIAEILYTSGTTAEPKGVIITHRNILANTVPIEREVAKYRKYGGPFFPIRFLNLLPLSHLFGQAMATFIPPMLPGIVVFMHGHNPAEIVRQIKARRVSVLVSVPKVLDVVRDYAGGVVPEAANPPAVKQHWLRKWWRYRRVHRLFGWKFWAFIVGAAPLEAELEEHWAKLGYLVIQGYGLTETAPIVSLNHPFHARKGTVGKPIAGVQVKIAEDGEILVRGDNVTPGYFNEAAETARAFEDGWLHTGDIGAVDESGQLYVRGRKKEMIVTPEGLNVFPEDVERALHGIAGVADSAVVGVRQSGQERVHAVLILKDGADAGQIVREANARLEDHQKIRGFSVWPDAELPRTEGTRKLKRREIQQWVASGGERAAGGKAPGRDMLSVLRELAPGRTIGPETTLEELGLSSLERVEMMVAMEQQLGAALDEGAFAQARTVGELSELAAAPREAVAPERIDFPRWNRSRWARIVRRLCLPTFILPLMRVFAWVRSEGRENLKDLDGPVIFAANHQSHFDVPAIFAAMPAKWRYRAAPAMSKEFFAAHFYPETFTWGQRFRRGLEYYLSCLMFTAFPLPQREAGARDALRYAGELAGDGYCVLIFPEGKRTEGGEIAPFQPGIGMMASRLRIPVVPVRIEGLNRVLHQDAKFPRPGFARVKFGKAMRLEGEDYAALARKVEEAVKAL